MAHISRPGWVMIAAFVFGNGMTLLQCLTAPVLGHTEGSEGFKAALPPGG
jgi:hypothetical protein